MTTLADRVAAAQRAAITTIVEAAILDGTSTATEAAGPTLADIAAAHAEAEQPLRYIERIEAEARAAADRLSAALSANPDAATLAALDYVDGIVSAAAVARRLLRDPDLLAATAAVERVNPTAAHPWRLAHGTLALSLIERSAQLDALDRLNGLLSALPVKP